MKKKKKHSAYCKSVLIIAIFIVKDSPVFYSTIMIINVFNYWTSSKSRVIYNITVHITKRTKKSQNTPYKQDYIKHEKYISPDV